MVLTSHSADLLDRDTISSDSIVAVMAENGETRLAPIDRAGRQALKEQLVSAGELLRLGHLSPDPDLAVPNQLKLFGTPRDRS